MGPLSRLPMPLTLTAFAALAMLIPAAHASEQDQHAIARNFFYCAVLVLILCVLIGLALGLRPRRNHPREALLTMVAVFGLLPVVLAIPFAQSLPDTGLFNAWWEMVSSVTTTGASLYAADLLPATLHLWRGIVGWLGGFFILVAATAILAPLRIGGFELISAPQDRPDLPRDVAGLTDPVDRLTHLSAPEFHTRFSDPSWRLLRAGAAVAPAYAGLTLALWVLLLMLGDPGLVALMRAMGTLSTSGISPVAGPLGAASGLPGEAAVVLFLLPALSRRFWPGGAELQVTQRLRDDPELRMATGLVALVVLVLFARHFIWIIEAPDAVTGGLSDTLSVIWAAAFNALSYLTTTGWGALEWHGVRIWSGLEAPGLMLAGLAMMGGGVATTAGGVKLMRVYALARHGEREMNRIIHPSAISGGGPMARRLRREGAFLAFIFFMLFALSLAGTMLLISLQRVGIESATVLSVAALTNTGQLASAIALTPVFETSAGIASAPWEGWSGLPRASKTVLALAMILGRVETLAILALMSPDFWRR